MSRYTYAVKPCQGQDTRWAVVETDNEDGGERIISQSRERDDANIIAGIFAGLEDGSIKITQKA